MSLLSSIQTNKQKEKEMKIEQPPLPLSSFAGITGDPIARHDHPDTSHDAAKSVTRRTVNAVISRIMTTLYSYKELTDEQIWAYIKHAVSASPSGVRTRRNELVKAGLVEFTGQKSFTKSGRMTRVWTLTPLGKKVMVHLLNARGKLDGKQTLGEAIKEVTNAGDKD